MILALTGEGKNDYGYRVYEKWIDGAVQVYVNKIAALMGKSVAISIIERKDVEAAKEGKRLQRSLKGLKGKGIPARRFRIIAKERGLDSGIYYCDSDRGDADKSSSESQAKKEYEELYRNVSAGLTIDKDDNSFIPMIPHRMIENWMLGDSSAIQICFSGKKSKSVNISKPEMAWGSKNDPNSNYPKHLLDRTVQSMDKKYKDYSVNTEDMKKIAEASDIDTLRSNCPISFARFYDDLTRILS